MIKQDFIKSEIKGSDSTILTEFEFLVSEMANKLNKELLKHAFKRGLEIQEENKYLEDLTDDQLLEDLTDDQLLEELKKALKKLADKLTEDDDTMIMMIK